VERYWIARARRLQLRVNVGWWLHYFLPASIAIGVIGAAAILIARKSGWSLGAIELAIEILFSAAAIGSFWLARGRFFSRRDALARLDLALGLFNRLTSASEGVGAWPPQRAGGDRIRWRASLVMPPLLLAPLLLASAWWIPIAPAERTHSLATAEPIAWTEIEEILDELAQEESVVDEPSLEEWRERLEELREQPEERWFEHSSLEAGDHLRDQLDGALTKLEEDLQQAQDALEKRDGEAWKQAMQDLELGKLKVDPSLSRELKAEELEALKKAIEDGVKNVKLARGDTREGEESDLLLLVEGDRAGGGGVDRGRADAELSLRPDPTDASTGEAHNLASKDLTRAALGDVIGTSEKEDEIDESKYRGPMKGGAIDHGGGGGETVWKSSLPPSEQDFLERYFR
jgi:hypothetical protein